MPERRPVDVPIREESIRLGQFLKLADLAETGSDAKELIAAGEVLVNGEPETRRGRQLRVGDVVEFDGRPARVARRPGSAAVLVREGTGATGGDRKEPFASVWHRQAGLTAKTGGVARAGRRGRRPHHNRTRRSSNSAEVDISHVMLSPWSTPARGIRRSAPLCRARGGGRCRTRTG